MNTVHIPDALTSAELGAVLDGLSWWRAYIEEFATTDGEEFEVASHVTIRPYRTEDDPERERVHPSLGNPRFVISTDDFTEYFYADDEGSSSHYAWRGFISGEGLDIWSN